MSSKSFLTYYVPGTVRSGDRIGVASPSALHPLKEPVLLSIDPIRVTVDAEYQAKKVSVLKKRSFSPSLDLGLGG